MSKKNRKQNDQIEETEAAQAEAEDAPKAKKSTRLTEAQIIERYPHVIEGTLQMEQDGKHALKQTIEAMLECGHVQRVATSDLFQVKRCAECKKPVKVERVAKAAKASKRPMATPPSSFVAQHFISDVELTELQAAA